MAEDDAPTTEEAQPLDQLVRRGLRWSFVNTAAGRTANFLVGVIIARIVVPDDYGTFAVALVTTTFLLSLNDVGVSAAIVRWPGDIREIASTAATLVLAVSTGMYLVLFAAAPWLARVLNVPDAGGLIRLLGLSVVLDALFAVPTVAITRSFAQHHRTLSDMVSLVFGSAVAIVLAARGYGAWGLAWGRLAGVLAGGIVILVVSPIRVRPGFDRRIARELLHFGAPLAGSAVLAFVMLNTDYVVVGHVLGAVALGYYYLAFNLSSWPVNTLSFSVRRVSLAGFSRLQHNAAEMRAAFASSLRLLALAAFPVCVLLAMLAAPLVHFVYGTKWAPAAAPLRWLAILGAIRVVAELTEDYLVGAGRPRIQAVVQGAWTIALIPVLVVGAHVHGIAGVGAGHVLVALAVVVPMLLWGLARSGVGPTVPLRAVVPALLLSALAVAGASVGLLATSRPFWQLAIGGSTALLFAGGAAVAMRKMGMLGGQSSNSSVTTAHPAQAGATGSTIPLELSDPG
jgi:PST family polysaccharide transporter